MENNDSEFSRTNFQLTFFKDRSRLIQVKCSCGKTHYLSTKDKRLISNTKEIKCHGCTLDEQNG